MFVLVHPGLLNKRHLIHTNLFKFLEVSSHIIRRSDSTSGTRERFRDVYRHFRQLFIANFSELLKKVCTSWFVLAKAVQSTKCVSEELKPFQSTVNGFFAVLMQ